MSSIVKISEKKYRVRWRSPDGGSRTATFTTKAAAEAHRTKIDHEKLSGQYVDRSAGKVTLRSYVAEHLERQPWRDRTRATAENSLRHVLDKLGDRQIGSIRPSDVQALISGLELAPSTVKVVAQHLRAVLRSAVRDGLIVKDPSAGVRLPRGDRGEVVPLSDDEVARLYDAASEPFRAGVVLGAALGLRQGEASGLTVDRVDFLRRTVRIDRQWSERYGWGPTKTTGSNRVVPVAAPVLELLAQHLGRYGPGEDGALVHWPWSGRPSGPMGSNAWAYEMRKAATKAGVVGVRFHGLRHHAASKLIASGLSVVAVARFLGHDNPSTTLRVYGHLWADDNDRILSAMASAWGSVSPACHDGSVQSG